MPPLSPENARPLLSNDSVHGLPPPCANSSKTSRIGVIAPDRLAEKRHVADARRARAAVHAVEPSIGAPRQAVGERVRVLESEAGQPYFGLAVREPVAGRVPIEEEVWRIHDPDAAVSGQDAGGDVQAGDDVLVRLERSIAVLVLEHRDLVGAPHMIRRRRGHAVVAGAEVLVVRGDGESGGKRILQVLHDPQASAIVEVQIDRLPDHRFRRDQLHRQPGEWPERAKRLIRRRGGLTLHPAGQLVAAVLQVDVDELVDLRRERPRLRPRHVPRHAAQQRRDGDRYQPAGRADVRIRHLCRNVTRDSACLRARVVWRSADRLAVNRAARRFVEGCPKNAYSSDSVQRQKKSATDPSSASLTSRAA